MGSGNSSGVGPVKSAGNGQGGFEWLGRAIYPRSSAVAPSIGGGPAGVSGAVLAEPGLGVGGFYASLSAGWGPGGPAFPLGQWGLETEATAGAAPTALLLILGSDAGAVRRCLLQEPSQPQG